MNQIVKNWYDTYTGYMVCVGVEDNLDHIWSLKSNQLMDYWNKMVSGEHQKLYDNFQEMLEAETKLYKSLIDYYERFGYIKSQMIRPGQRYLP